MSMSLLITKLYVPPPRPRFVRRPRLIRRLGEGLHLDHRLTLVAAPAGCGKTALLSDWLRQADRPGTWLSLDEGDNDPARFLAYLIAALQKIDATVGQAAQAMVQAPQQPPLEVLLTGLVNDVAATAEPFILVLDDYHLIASPAIHQALSFLLDHTPSPQQGLHLVLATRADPPLPIARLRARGQLTELHAADLRFAPDETAAFLNDEMGLALSAEQLDALERRTEGWITGLQLAALSIVGRDDVSAFIRAFTGSHRYVLDYLTDEVLSRQSKQVRRFLLQTAILERLTGPLCDAVTGEDNGQEILESLEAANLFLIPLDDERRWYRYHHLFAGALRQTLEREGGEQKAELHRRASEWYEQEELIGEAVDHALACGDFERAAHLIQQAGWATFTRGEMTTILGWLAALPGDVVRSSPQLGILDAWAMAKSGDLDGAELCLQGAGMDRLPGQATAVRAYVAGVRGDLARAAELSRQALEHLPGEDLLLQAIVAQNLGVAYHWSGDPGAAVRTLGEAVRLSRAAGQPFQTLTAMAILGRAHEMRGALRRAMETYRTALELVSEADGQPVPFACMAYVGMAGVRYEWNDLDGATRDALEGVRLSGAGGFVAYRLFGQALLAQILEAKGDRDGAVAWVEKAEQLGEGRGSGYALVVALVAEVRVRLWLARRDVRAAARWARARRLNAADELDSAREIEQMAVARVLIAQDRPAEALNLLAWLLEAAQPAGRLATVIRIRVLQALAFQAQGNVDQALAALEEALSLAGPEGYVRTFLDEGEPMVRLLRRGVAEGIVPDYAGELLAALAQCSGAAPPVEETSVAQPPEPLTAREVEVLRLIAAGLSNREIAGELVIALSTVKSHINNLYSKLDVRNRAEAISRGRALGLL